MKYTYLGIENGKATFVDTNNKKYEYNDNKFKFAGYLNKRFVNYDLKKQFEKLV